VPLARTLPTYCGDDADAEALKRELAVANSDTPANLPEWADFLDRARTALATYNAAPHRSLPRGQSPDAAWAEAVADGWRPTPLGDDDLHDLLPAESRIVQRGEITLPWGRYAADDLRRWHGQRVTVSFNPMDGRRVWVSDDRGRLICVAERGANERAYIPENQLAHARAQREAGRVERLERKLADVREEGAAALPHLATPIDPEIHAATVAAVTEQQESVAAITDERRLHAYWLRVGERVEAGAEVEAADRQGWAIYRASPAYHSMQEFFDSFGLVAGDFN
jgi:putative transposase